MTIGVTNRSRICLDTRYNILNFKGEIASIVRQYDRKLDIFDEIKYKYLYKIMPNIIKEND